MNEVAALKNKVNTNNLQKEFVQKQAADFQKKLDHLSVQLQEFEQDLAVKRSLLEAVDLKIQHDRHLQSEVAGQMIAKEDERTAIENKNLDWKERIRGLESKFGLLDEMERSFQGYFQGVKALLAEAIDQPFFKSIKGIVADLMKVQMGMELAISKPH